ncbi:MAG TPA: response regulator [Terriglobales bacterium]|nr:response regulator [Terriglobales bacterium]
MPEPISVLFVDDEDSIRVTLPLVLEKHGFKVTSAGSVPEALNLISQRKFQVLITDLNIGHPGDGFGIVSAMRSTQPTALRFILTGYPAFESALEAMRQQVDDYIVKPADTQTLINTIRSQFEKRTPAKLMPPKRLPDVVQQNLPSIISEFLKAADNDPEISSVNMTELERTDHIPRVLEVAMRVAREGSMHDEDREASALHGSLRRKQGYTVPLLLREAMLLKRTLAGCMQEHLLEIDISYLVRDMINAFGTIDELLEESVEAFLRPALTSATSDRTPHKKTKSRGQ